MDETIIHNFGVPLKIVARFYSSNLVEYLVNELHMPTSNIKCRITTEKAPKPDTFHDFLLYIFKMFPEAEAKKLANSFIGELVLTIVLHVETWILYDVSGHQLLLRVET